MFKKILIANRGEIACRIIKSARKLGIKTVAVYSDADRDGLHVEMADEAVAIGPPPAAQSYLLIDKIVDACRSTGAEAVHPGYGFLSEREAFPIALEKAGIVFIGPNPRAIAAMGDKIESKKAAAKATVSPLLDAKTRKAMGEQAVALSKAVGYDSAGTVEFVAGQDRSFYFLEMNTRLQVEHPVTELVTGIDLVEQMIRVAAGEKLKIRQADVKLTGWAVESRVYAEDPYRNFLPSIGRLTRYRPPQEGSANGGTVRNDTGVFEGAEISMYYDPMIAKLVTHAATREAAIDLQADALDAFVIDGVEHNIPFLAALMQHPRWREGRLSTGFIAEEFKGGFKPRVPQGQELQLLAAVAIAVDHLANARRRQITDQMGGPAVRFASRRIAMVGP